LKDFVSGSSATLIKNPNYWGYDERYPQNKLPYIDTIKYLIITDDNEALAAMRGGKIDVMYGVSIQQAQAIRRTNPEILQITDPLETPTVDPRNDKAPFSDIRVRKAMQMAIDLPTIAKSYYGGAVEPYPSTLTSRYMKGWGFPYEEWPQDLKDEYAYNPTAAKELLADAGYPHGFKTNIVADIAGDIDLLRIVKSYFGQVGIDMEIRTMDSDSWINFVKTGHKHDQLAHYPSGPLGHCSAPLHDLTRFQKGGHTNYLMISDPVYDALYAKAMVTSTVDEMKQVMTDANERVVRQHYTVSLLQPISYSLYQPWLKGFNGQFGSIWSRNGGPGRLSFYLGRFWIDLNLRKSMGH
jgi:peptide/nickel transport system substrate-binding protein